MERGKRSSIEFRLKVLTEHKDGNGSFRELSKRYDIDARQLKRWSAWYKEYGIPQKPKKAKETKAKNKTDKEKIKQLELEIELLKKVQDELRG